MSGLALVSIKFFDARPKDCIIVGIFGAIIMSCLLMMEGENRD